MAWNIFIWSQIMHRINFIVVNHFKLKLMSLEPLFICFSLLYFFYLFGWIFLFSIYPLVNGIMY